MGFHIGLERRAGPSAGWGPGGVSRLDILTLSLDFGAGVWRRLAVESSLWSHSMTLAQSSAGPHLLWVWHGDTRQAPSSPEAPPWAAGASAVSPGDNVVVQGAQAFRGNPRAAGWSQQLQGGVPCGWKHPRFQNQRADVALGSPSGTDSCWAAASTGARGPRAQVGGGTPGSSGPAAYKQAPFPELWRATGCCQL